MKTALPSVQVFVQSQKAGVKQIKLPFQLYGWTFVQSRKAGVKQGKLPFKGYGSSLNSDYHYYHLVLHIPEVCF